MQLKKEIVLLYVLIIFAAAVIIAAEKPVNKAVDKPGTKCCKLPKPIPSAAPLNSITQGFIWYKA